MLKGSTGAQTAKIINPPATKVVFALKRCQYCGKFKRTSNKQNYTESGAKNGKAPPPLYYCDEVCQRAAFKEQQEKQLKRSLYLASAKKKYEEKKYQEAAARFGVSSPMPEKPKPPEDF
jgi:hypothetical protein